MSEDSECEAITFEQSKGNQNRYSFWCGYLEQRRFYGTCLCLKDAFDAGRIKETDLYCDCAKAMASDKCDAYRMRQEELSKGKVLYFTPVIQRVTLSANADIKSESYQRGWHQVGRALGKDEPAVVRAPFKSKPTVPGLQIKNVNMGDLISRETAKEATRSFGRNELILLKKKIIDLAKTDPTKARELLQKAKRMEIALQQGASHVA